MLIQPKPEIADEARARITAFIQAILDSQELHGVAIYGDEGSLALVDLRRSSEWIMSDGTKYGEFDAMIYGTDANYATPDIESIEFEDFAGWDK